MRAKSKVLLTTAMFAVMLCLFAVLFVVAPQGATTASAATNTSAVCVTNGRLETLNGGVVGQGSPSGNYNITMESSNTSGTGTLEDHCVINWNYVKIKLNIIKISDHHTFTLDKDGANIYALQLSGKESRTLYEGALTDANYVFS